MQTSDGQTEVAATPEANAIKAELMKESWAERLDAVAANIDKTGNEVADKIRGAAGGGIGLVSNGVKQVANAVRNFSVPDVLAKGSDAQSRALTSIAIGAGAGLFVGLFIRKLVK
ncbi:MAG: hypothetical protein M1335_05390 [Chloroflexi bacterium]|nr:hypothetical protein [Chloroflexota bacterium]